MNRDFPLISWHLDRRLDAVRSTAPSEVKERFKDVPDFNIDPLTDDPALVTAVTSVWPQLQTHAEALHRQWMPKYPYYDSTTYDLEVLVRLVTGDAIGRHAEMRGVQGRYDDPNPKILLLCAVPDMLRLTTCLTHELGHHFKHMTGPSNDNYPLAYWLQTEVAAEQLVVESHGLEGLTHNRICSAPARAQIHRLLIAEEDRDDEDIRRASSHFVCTRDTGLEAYALVNELVRLGRWTFGELLHMNDRAFRDALLSSPDLWVQDASEAQA